MTDEEPIFRDVDIEESFDSRELLRNAAKQAQERNYDDFLIVDADAHHYETESWLQIADYIEDPVIRRLGTGGGVSRLTGHSPLLSTQIGNQDVSGRISRYGLRRFEETEEDRQRDVVLVTRAMEMIGIDYQILFPSPMLNLGLHPVIEIEVAVARAYARWIVEHVLSQDDRIRSMLYLPFNDPEASLRIVEEFADAPGIVGFMVTTVRHRPVHHNSYMRLYRAIEERRLPLGFHAGYSWSERPMEQLNKFISVHALGFPFYSMLHLTNWIINGLPERFPGLKLIWIESGLSWIPFMMQRLDMEYLARSSEAPLLKRRPSEYMREMFFTSQPMEQPDNLEMLRLTFEMIDAENKLLFASDYPHWDFDLPSRIYDLPFLSETAKRKILGGNAATLFGLDTTLRKHRS